MEEQRGISSAVASEPASNSGLSGEKRNRNEVDHKDELGSRRVKVRDLDSDAKPSNMQSDGNIGKVQKPNLSSEHKPVAPDAKGLGRVVKEKEVVASNIKPSRVLETSNSISTDDDRRLANSEKQALLENHSVKDDSNRGGQVDSVSKNSSILKPRETSESGVSPRGAAEPDLLQMSSAERRWMEMKKYGFLSNRSRHGSK